MDCLYYANIFIEKKIFVSVCVLSNSFSGSGSICYNNK